MYHYTVLNSIFSPICFNSDKILPQKILTTLKLFCKCDLAYCFTVYSKTYIIFGAKTNKDRVEFPNKKSCKK